MLSLKKNKINETRYTRSLSTISTNIHTCKCIISCTSSWLFVYKNQVESNRYLPGTYGWRLTRND